MDARSLLSRARYLVALVILLALAVPASPAHASGVVSVCDEAHLLAALAGGGTVTFSCSGTITLTAEIVISTDTTIDGSGQTVIVSGNNAVRVFTVDSGVTLNLDRLTIADGTTGYQGWGGGGVSNAGTLSVTNSTFSGNSAYSTIAGAAIYNVGTLIVSNSTFSDNRAEIFGGGISNHGGAISIINSTFTGNYSGFGGGGIANGIANTYGTATVSNSIFSGNHGWCSGGAIFSPRGTLSVGNSTFSGNSAGYCGPTGGGGISNGDTLTVTNSTFAGNGAVAGGGAIDTSGLTTVSNSTFSSNSAGCCGGAARVDRNALLTIGNSTFSENSTNIGNAGGVYAEWGTIILRNTIVAHSSAGGNCAVGAVGGVIGGVITDGGGNLSYPDATCPGISADPLLGPLQDNGGPTWTMALLPGSPAIDAADDAICAAEPVNNLDQRGIVRPQGAHCDIGAFELEVALLPIAIDIKPDTTENVIGANKKGIIQVAILSSENFDALAEVDRSSLTFGRTGDESSLQVKKDGSPKCEPWDVNYDGRNDLVCHFWGKLAGFQAGDTEGVLKGMALAGVPLEGRDMVRIVP